MFIMLERNKAKWWYCVGESVVHYTVNITNDTLGVNIIKKTNCCEHCKQYFFIQLTQAKLANANIINEYHWCKYFEQSSLMIIF